MMHWAAKYVGLRHSPGARGPLEVDCWGLLALVYADVYGIELPDFPGLSILTVREFSEPLERETLANWTEVEEPFEGAAVAMGRAGKVYHAGVAVFDGGWKILHSWDRHNVVLDTPRGLRLKGLSHAKFYRHKLWPQ